MAQLKIGALRDFEGNSTQIYLVQRGTICQLANHCEKEYLVIECDKNTFKKNNNNDLEGDIKANHTLYHFDTFREAQDKYLELADRDGKNLKVRKWSPKNWKDS